MLGVPRTNAGFPKDVFRPRDIVYDTGVVLRLIDIYRVASVASKGWTDEAEAEGFGGSKVEAERLRVA